jgi:hypothetical protein
LIGSMHSNLHQLVAFPHAMKKLQVRAAID